MQVETHLFIDFDDTLSDFAKHGELYVRELAAQLTSECGGSPEIWAQAIPPALKAGVERYLNRFAGSPIGDYAAWLDEERERVVRGIFRAADQTLPDEPLLPFARRMQFDSLICCNASFPGAADCLNALFEAGIRIQMASSQDSEYLLAALMGAGLESYVESKFGPDLIECAKEGPEYYERIFEATGITADQAIVVDDQAICLEWARQAGARTIQARIRPDTIEPVVDPFVTSLADLPALVTQLAKNT